MSAPGTALVWSRDLAMGVRFAFGGGREGWLRTLFTGVGVGLGVALLLIGTAVPGALAAREERGDARSLLGAPTAAAPGRGTLLIARSDMTYHGRDIEGRLLKPEGPDAPLPPGLKAFPAPGELAVSPALRELLRSAEGALLRERLDGRIGAVIADAGLAGPAELAFYRGADVLPAIEPGEFRVQRITGFAPDPRPRGLSPVLMLTVLLTFVALLLPVAVFIAAAVRSGGERRDQRLAALRLVGADGRTVRRIAAGEALAGAVAGLLLGSLFFVAGRRLVGSLSLSGRSVFPADLTPAPGLVALVVLAVPAAAVAVTLFTLRGVVIEPLGVLRTAATRRRRVWWRLLLPLGGLGLLLPLALARRGDGGGGRFNQWQVSAGVVLLLVGVTALLPWLLERCVGRLRGGAVSWQLAVRRLQVAGGSSARLVNGIAVAVAGAIALQMLFSGAEGSVTEETGQDPSRASVAVMMHGGTESGLEDLGRRIAETPGVTRAVPLNTVGVARQVPSPGSPDLTIGTCQALAEVAEIGQCRDGDVFVLSGGPLEGTAGPGDRVFAGDVRISPDESARLGGKTVEWTVPAGARTVRPREDPTGALRAGLLATPSAAPKDLGRAQFAQVYVQLDDSVPDALERVRTAAFKADPLATAMTLRSTKQDGSLPGIRAGLFFGATGVLVLIGTSLLVGQLEQLRERRRLLAALVAFGTRRSTLCLSVLWQTALPVALGLVLAAAAGIGLGSVLMGMAHVPVRVEWSQVLLLTGAGAGLVAAVTLLSLPPLLRMMRPDGLRTE
ncbi:ABC transporter permease [Streptomyces katrae]|uniref:ABC transporter permease n=1 Tax=Streptomyces katrae TaxID=68223 RepID=A0ABT7GRQ2_9ACTN|nr:FtsX-like permease family protein [Streptomyces katrae]MDK9496287.1 ABC transporter permease [Streptomyces katrae]